MKLSRYRAWIDSGEGQSFRRTEKDDGNLTDLKVVRVCMGERKGARKNRKFPGFWL